MHRWTRSFAAALAGLFGAAALAADAPLKEGDKAPVVDLPATQPESALPELKGHTTLKLSDFQGKKNVVVFFFPKALTGG